MHNSSKQFKLNQQELFTASHSSLWTSSLPSAHTEVSVMPNYVVRPDHKVSSGTSEILCQLWFTITGHAHWTTDKLFTTQLLVGSPSESCTSPGREDTRLHVLHRFSQSFLCAYLTDPPKWFLHNCIWTTNLHSDQIIPEIWKLTWKKHLPRNCSC